MLRQISKSRYCANSSSSCIDKVSSIWYSRLVAILAMHFITSTMEFLPFSGCLSRKIAEQRMVPTMSLELALQRELAYRKKVVSMLSDAEAAKFLKDLVPIQLPSSSKHIAPDHHPRDQFRPTSATSASHQELSLAQSPGPERRPNSGPRMVPLGQVCHSAPVSKPSLVPTRFMGTTSLSRPAFMGTSTYSGGKRKPTASSFQCLPSRQPVPSHIIDNNNPVPGIYFCQVCNVSCSGSSNYTQHLRGHKHKAKLLKQSRNGVAQNQSQKPRCELCQIWCTDQNALSLHFKGQKHKAKVQELLFGNELVDRRSAKQFWCEMFRVPCTNEDTFMLHLKGEKPCCLRLCCWDNEEGNATM